MCGYVCHGCGRCKGESKIPTLGSCLVCGVRNEPGTKFCSECGAILMTLPGKPMPPEAFKTDG